MMRSMVIDMNDEQVHTLAQMQAFLDGTVALEFAVAAKERYGFIGRTVRRFGYLRAIPGRVSYGSAGNGSGPHISGEMLNRLAKVSAVHVPYKVLGPALGDLLASQIEFMFDGGGRFPRSTREKSRCSRSTAARASHSSPTHPR